jgi:hypothetical protein
MGPSGWSKIQHGTHPPLPSWAGRGHSGKERPLTEKYMSSLTNRKDLAPWMNADWSNRRKCGETKAHRDSRQWAKTRRDPKVRGKGIVRMAIKRCRSPLDANHAQTDIILEESSAPKEVWGRRRCAVTLSHPGPDRPGGPGVVAYLALWGGDPQGAFLF